MDADGAPVVLHRTTTASLLRALRSQTPRALRLASLLFAEPGHIVPETRLADGLWGDDAGGGPLNASNAIHQDIVALRKARFPIETWYGRGYRVAP